MKIKFISPELHAELTTLCNDYPELTLQNVGYQYIGPEVREAHKEQIDRISEILKEHIVGFAQFFNFRRRKKDAAIELRFDYDWGAEGNTMPYKGVGYALLDELRDGFPEGASQC